LPLSLPSFDSKSRHDQGLAVCKASRFNSIISLLIALTGVSPLSAQRAETRGEQSPALIAGRDAIVNYGLTREQVQELTKAAAAGAVGPLAKEIVDLSNRLGVTQGAALSLLRIVGPAPS
jgi:hypothetical protein